MDRCAEFLDEELSEVDRRARKPPVEDLRREEPLEDRREDGLSEEELGGR
jgi:hypothetical protein